MSDLIDRESVINEIVAWTVEDRPDVEMPTDLIDRVKALPPAHPELNEWCHDCKEYDLEKGCCPRWGQVIKTALEEAKPEIIRCKDCKHKHLENMVWTCSFGLPGGENFFCGYGAEPYKGEQE